ncbi:Repeat domain-containing protein [Micromonospora phaseoli]|uniref:Repeat domain-containing protein n=1 Tax=Micromonospora phaseoli TaxID=1144548 RepID=A0A1H7ACC1_9ACTN|nr:S8 family serine peptidase [Micromonospora phaseoli]PZV96491.1 VCBS repeat protein [Micromonospora phaseoli]GIJ76180.1 hypothetical protein Xph01_06120 [Micromonospora phaseoli]SEJ62586.1 Repeat domain-containing protein [Micromonospora phaseoli]
MPTVRYRWPRLRWPRLTAAALLTATLLVSTGLTPDTSPASAAPAGKEDIADSYVVVLAFDDKELDDKDKEGTKENIDKAVAGLLAEYPGKLTHTYYHALPGFAVHMSKQIAEALAKNPLVAYVAPQMEIEWLGGEQRPPSWGLDIIDQRRDFDGIYRWDSDGTGVNAYVVDSGIRTTHEDFGGRVVSTVTFGQTDVGPGGSHDCFGHGTPMAGTIGGRLHGVAKNVRLHSIRLGCTTATTADMIAVMDWLHVNAVRPAVVNLSWRVPGINPPLDAAVSRVVDRGITVVAAAGNSDHDACRFSPGRVPAVITVGSIHALKDRIRGTSWGPCVDLFAPGEQVTTTTNDSDTATTNFGNGTSIAAAHVTGAAARYLDRFPDASPELVATTLINEASKDRITDIAGSPNRVLYLDRNGPGNDGFGRTGSDVDGDGRDDIVTFTRGAAADVWVALSTGSGFTAGTKWHEYFSAGEEIPLLGDVDGDGRDDLITFTRGASAHVYVALSTGTSFGPSQLWHTRFAVGNETPVVGDFNGDGRDDIATVTRGIRVHPSTNRTVFVALSNGSQFVGTGVSWTSGFPGADAIPLVGDFDCDGRDDLVAVDRVGAGLLRVSASQGDRFATATYWGHPLALGTDVPAVGDVNGDGCADLVGFARGDRRSVVVALSMVRSWSLRQFGTATVWHRDFASGVQVPGVGDFTGDGRDDVIAFTRGHAADVYVAPATAGSSFSTDVRRWSDWFAYGTEIPMPAVLW